MTKSNELAVLTLNHLPKPFSTFCVRLYFVSMKQETQVMTTYTFFMQQYSLTKLDKDLRKKTEMSRFSLHLCGRYRLQNA